MRVAIVKTYAGLIPATDEDQAKVATLSNGEIYSFDVKRFRNYGFHKKFFALISLAFENQEHYVNIDHFRKVMTMKAGYFDEVATDKGLVFLPRSIAFDKMEQEEFELLYDRVLDECIKVVPLDRNDVQKELAGFG